MCSLFQRVLYTPPLDAGSLRGITRGAVMDLAEELSITYVEQALIRYDLWTADECFLTGTAAEVIPCVEVDIEKLETDFLVPKRRLIESFRKRY